MAGIISNKGNQRFTHNGFTYVCDKEFKRSTCEVLAMRKESEKCKGRLHTDNEANAVLQEVGHHCHDSDAAKDTR